MSVYLYPIKQAGLIFLIAFALLMIPTMIFQYRKYGSVSTGRSIILYGFLFYMIAAYFLVILPLPVRESVTNSYRDMMQLVPFAFVRDFFTHTNLRLGNSSTYLPALLQGVVTQPVFNVFLTIPFGMFLRYYFDRTWKETLIASFLLSLFFELSQLSGLYGIYPGPYRLFDIDDLFLNTSGGMIGYLISPLINVFFPSRRELDRLSYERGHTVSYIRRFIAYSVDLVLLGFLSNILNYGVRAVGLSMVSPIVYPILFMVYFAVFPVAFDAPTMGQRLVKIEVVSDTNQTLKALLIRAAFVLVFFDYGAKFINLLWDIINNSNTAFYTLGVLFVFGIQVLWYAFITIHLIYTARHSHKLFYETISKTSTVSTIE